MTQHLLSLIVFNLVFTESEFWLMNFKCCNTLIFKLWTVQQQLFYELLLHVGSSLDTLARRPLWQYGLDYGHGTGHGIGMFLNVHEGQFQPISSRCTIYLCQQIAIVLIYKSIVMRNHYSCTCRSCKDCGPSGIFLCIKRKAGL